MHERTLHWWAVGIGKALLALLIVLVPLSYAANRYRIGIEGAEGPKCLPYTFFLIDRYDHALRRDQFIAFRAARMGPFYEDGTTMVKIVAGVPGDQVRVGQGRVRVNDRDWGDLPHAEKGGRLWSLGRRMTEFEREEAIPAGRLWVLTAHPRSYDSRYWGYVETSQVIGRAYPIW